MHGGYCVFIGHLTRTLWSMGFTMGKIGGFHHRQCGSFGSWRGWSAWPKNGWYIGSFGCVWKWGLHPVSTAQKDPKGSSKRPWKEIFWDSQLAWFSVLFPAAYHFLYSLPFPAVLPQKSWCPAQGQMVGLNHAAWNTESFRANHITFRRSWSNFWGI